VEDEYHKRDKKRAAGDVNGPAAKKHSNSPPSAEKKEEGTKQIAKEDEDEDEDDPSCQRCVCVCSVISIYLS